MSSQMEIETRQAPEVAAKQLAANAGVVTEVAQQLRDVIPANLLTLARGSSDHAASFFAYAAMAASGQAVTSVPSSLVNVHGAPRAHPNTWALAWSQSGQSPDLVSALRHFANGGSPTVAWVNDTSSPLANAARWAIDLHAGPERSVAATKSYLAQLVAGLHLLAQWQKDDALMAGLMNLPGALACSLAAPWQAAIDAWVDADQLYVIARGTAWPLAMEAALKFKEVCGIHAEAFSSAEVMHGPMALIRPGFAVLVIAPQGPEQASALRSAQALRERGASVLVAASGHAADLPIADTGISLLDGVSAMQSFYVMVEALARAKGLHPDQPAHLSKVTKTH